MTRGLKNFHDHRLAALHVFFFRTVLDKHPGKIAAAKILVQVPLWSLRACAVPRTGWDNLTSPAVTKFHPEGIRYEEKTPGGFQGDRGKREELS